MRNRKIQSKARTAGRLRRWLVRNTGNTITLEQALGHVAAYKNPEQWRREWLKKGVFV